MSTPSLVTLNMDEDPDLAMALGNKAVGEECKGTIEFRVDEIVDNMVKGSVISFTPSGYKRAEYKESDDDSASPKKTQPIIAILNAD